MHHLLNAFRLLFSIPHELIHYLAARLLGVPVEKLDRQSVHIIKRGVPTWKILVVGLAPTLASLLICGGFLAFLAWCGLSKTTAIITIWGEAYGLILFASCARDWLDIFVILCGE